MKVTSLNILLEQIDFQMLKESCYDLRCVCAHLIARKGLTRRLTIESSINTSLNPASEHTNIKALTITVNALRSVELMIVPLHALTIVKVWHPRS